jgi:hypothetical protein
MPKQIQVMDSGALRTVEVDEARYAAFDSVRPALSSILTADASFSGRDAQEAMSFLVSQLTYTENQTFERMYQPMQYEQLIPIDYSAGEWADAIRYEIYDFVGQGKRHSSAGSDVPMVDVGFADKSWPVLYGSIGYDYTQEELRRSAYLRRALPERKLAAAVEGYKRHMNQVGLFGETASNITGLFNNALVPQGNAPTGGWGSATADNILNDINTLIQNIWTNTAYNDTPDTIVLAPAALATIASKPRSTTSDTTILEFVKANNIAKQQRGIQIDFQPGFQLNTAGVGSTRRMMGYVKNPNRLVMHIPLPLRFLAPQLVGLGVQVPGEYKYSGVEIRYPKSAYYMDNI